MDVVNGVHAVNNQDSDRPSPFTVIDIPLSKLWQKDGSFTFTVLRKEGENPIPIPLIGAVIFGEKEHNPHYLLEEGRDSEFFSWIKPFEKPPIEQRFIDDRISVLNDLQLNPGDLLDVFIETLPELRMRMRIRDRIVTQWVQFTQKMNEGDDVYICLDCKRSDIQLLGPSEKSVFVVLGREIALFKDSQCALCADLVVDRFQECGHPLCFTCKRRMTKINNKQECPVCRKSNETYPLRFESSLCAVDKCIDHHLKEGNTLAAIPCGCVYGKCMPKWNMEFIDGQHKVKESRQCLRCSTTVDALVKLYQ